MKIEKEMPWLNNCDTDEEVRRATPKEVLEASQNDGLVEIEDVDGCVECYVALPDDELYPLAQEIEDEFARRARAKK